METIVNTIKQTVSDNSFALIPNLQEICIELRLIEEKLAITYKNHRSHLYISTVAPPIIPLPSRANFNEYKVVFELTSLFESTNHGPKFFMDYAKLIAKISQLYKIVNEVGGWLAYEMSSANETLNIFIETKNKQQWLIISHGDRGDSHLSQLWLDIKQFRKWYRRQRKHTIESVENRQKHNAELQEELITMRRCCDKVDNILNKTLDRLNETVASGEFLSYGQNGKLEKPKRVVDVLYFGLDKLKLDIDPLSYITLIDKIIQEQDLVTKLDERRVKQSYAEQDWLTMSIHLHKKMFEKILAVLPMLNLLDQNLSKISIENKDK